jgi:hypothetical protein
MHSQVKRQKFMLEKLLTISYVAKIFYISNYNIYFIELILEGSKFQKLKLIPVSYNKS